MHYSTARRTTWTDSPTHEIEAGKVYANCIDGQDDVARQRIEQALAITDTGGCTLPRIWQDQ